MYFSKFHVLTWEIFVAWTYSRQRNSCAEGCWQVYENMIVKKIILSNMLPLCTLTGLAPVMSSSSRTGMCGALLWPGWTCGSGEPAPYTPNPGPWDLLKFPCTHPTLTPQRAGENGSSGQADTKATITAPTQPLFPEENSSDRLSGEWTEAAAPHIHHQAWQGVPTKVDFYEVQFWQPCLVLECSFVGEEKSAFVYLVSFYCYGRDNIAIIISKVQSQKRANSRLQYIKKW